MYALPRLTEAHLQALARRRRIVMHEDANMPMEMIGTDLARGMAFRFEHVDRPGSMIDAVWWDIGFAEDTYALYDSQLLPKLDHPGFRTWWDAGIDWVGEIVRQTKARGLECFWNNRVCPVDLPQPWVSGSVPHDHPSRRNPLKAAHPEWVNPCWWPFGLWNLAHPEVRRRKVAILHELVSLYEFDGIQLDFARHTPCLPPGHEWDHRHDLTTFVHDVRAMLLRAEDQVGRPLLLAARVPEDEASCRADGFDVEAWIREGLVDIVVPGGRTTSIDLPWYRQLTAGTPVRKCCSFDGHHTTDGYYQPSVPYYRGVFSGLWYHGADCVAVFNWSCAAPEAYDRLGLPAMMKCASQTEALLEIGDPGAMARKAVVFAVERRGGYPWAGQAFYRNEERPLPCRLPDDGTPLRLILPVANVPLDCGCDRPAARLRLILRGGVTPDDIEVAYDGHALEGVDIDPSWQDGQIYGDDPQPNAGAWQSYAMDNGRQLARLDLDVPRDLVKTGLHTIDIRLKAPKAVPVHVEKVELHLGPHLCCRAV